MAQPYPITDLICTRTVRGHLFTGEYWQACPLEVFGTTANDDAYRVQNPAGKHKLVEVYRSIIFTHPTYGAGAFKAAVKRDPWGPQDCRQWGDVAPQGYVAEGADPVNRSEWRKEGFSRYAVDGTREGWNCVHATIYVPTGTAPVGGWGVFVWNHGGGDNFLSSMRAQLRAQRAAAEGFIVVMVNRRLGTLGSYYHPAMEAEPEWATNGANFGLSDAIAALEWVKDNISYFDGNPLLITIGGSSAGGNITLALLAHPYAKTLFQRVWSSSASANVQVRWQFGPYRHTAGLERWHKQRNDAFAAAAPYFRDALNPSRPFSAAIAEKGFLPALRENLSLEDFMSLDGGGRDYSGRNFAQWQTGTYYTVGKTLVYNNEVTDVAINHTSGNYETDFADGKIVAKSIFASNQSRSLTLMNDGISVSYPCNRDAAKAGAFGGAHQVVSVVAGMEASVVSYGSGSHNWAREVHQTTGENWTQWLTGPIVNTNYNGAVSAAWSSIETNRMAFNMGYWHTTRRVAQSVVDAGGTAYALFGNFTAKNAPRKLCGHTWDTFFIFGNPNLSIGEGLLVADDVRVSDGMIKALRNFIYSGNLNTDPALASDVGLDLFATDWGQTFVPYSLVNKNWNVVGSTPWRETSLCTPDVTNRALFWDHAFSHIEGLSE